MTDKTNTNIGGVIGAVVGAFATLPGWLDYYIDKLSSDSFDLFAHNLPSFKDGVSYLFINGHVLSILLITFVGCLIGYFIGNTMFKLLPAR